MEENNNNYKLPKRNIVLYLSVVVILMSFTFRASYAFYTATVTNLTNPTPTVLESGNLELKFANGSKYINAQNLSLTTAEAAASATDNYSSFTITNTGTLTGNYKLYLSNYSITKNLINSDFKWKLTINGTTYTGTFYDLFNGMTPDANGIVSSSTVDIPLISNSISLPAGSNHSGEFRIWLEEADHNQIGLTEGEFRTTIRLIAVS